MGADAAACLPGYQVKMTDVNDLKQRVIEVWAGVLDRAKRRRLRDRSVAKTFRSCIQGKE